MFHFKKTISLLSFYPTPTPLPAKVLAGPKGLVHNRSYFSKATGFEMGQWQGNIVGNTCVVAGAGTN